LRSLRINLCGDEINYPKVAFVLTGAVYFARVCLLARVGRVGYSTRGDVRVVSRSVYLHSSDLDEAGGLAATTTTTTTWVAQEEPFGIGEVLQETDGGSAVRQQTVE